MDELMQNSLPRLFAGINDALVGVVLPAVDDEFARVQLAACIELLGNIAARVEWRADLLDEVTRRAEEAIDAATGLAPGLEAALGAPPTAGAEPIAARDAALARVSRALRWCHAHDPGAVAPLVAFAAWHLDHERSLLRTGMYRR